jgi:hypothetical protein
MSTAKMLEAIDNTRKPADPVVTLKQNGTAANRMSGKE